MQHLVSMGLALLATACVCLVGCQTAKTVSPTLSAGAAEAIITPTRDADAIHDDLFVRALVISDGETTLAILTADMLVISREKVSQIRTAIRGATGIPEENITINVAHTHNTRPRSGGKGKWGDGLTYDQWLTGQFVKVAVEAHDTRRPAVLRVDRVPVQVGFNRRLMTKNGDIWMAPNPNGPHPAWSDTLGAYGLEDNKRIALLFTYAAHPVVVHESSNLITADVPGATIREMRSIVTDSGRLPLEGVFMFGQGCGGNANMYPLRGGFSACEAVGRDFAKSIAVLNDPKDITPGKLSVRDLTLVLPHRPAPSAEEVKLLMTTNEGDPRIERLLKVSAQGRKPNLRDYSMRAMAIGDELCILSLPYETFGEYQLYAVDVSPFKHTIVLGYCNGGDGYIATAADYKRNAATDYEAGLMGNSLDRAYPLPLDASVENIIRAGIRQLLNEVKSSSKR